jgi:hypothetical protein
LGKSGNWAISAVLLSALGLLGIACPASAGTASEEIEDVIDQADNSRKSTNRLIIPVPISNPQVGSGLILGVAWFYQPLEGSNPWTSGVAGMATSNDSRALAAFHNMSLSDDSIRINSSFALADVNLKYFGVGEDAGDEGEYVELNQDAALVQIKATKEIFPDFYVGGRLKFLDLGIAETDREEVPPSLANEDLQVSIRSLSFGPVLSYDSRDNSFSPQSGLLITGEWLFTEISKDYTFDYNKARLSGNAYFPLGSRTVFATRASLCRASDNAPFFDQCNFGSSSDLRGYVSGQYRDLASWAAQGEVRQRLFGKFGAVAFGGIGSVANDISGFGSADLLPAGGVGLRYAVAGDYGVNLRVDAAWGRNSNGIYVSVGEAF